MKGLLHPTLESKYSGEDEGVYGLRLLLENSSRCTQREVYRDAPGSILQGCHKQPTRPSTGGQHVGCVWSIKGLLRGH